MSGAELLAMARHQRGAGEDDAQTAQHLVSALQMLVGGLPQRQRHNIAVILVELMIESDLQPSDIELLLTNS